MPSSTKRFRLFRNWVDEHVLRKVVMLGVAAGCGDGNRPENEVVEEWYRGLTRNNQRFAQDLFGRVGGFPIEYEGDRTEPYKHTTVAFERLRCRDCLRDIEAIESG
jgi:hypothetical protein